jgi:hypothetical protein
VSKRGRLSQDEMQFIRDHAHDMTVAELCQRFDRNPETIEKYMASVLPRKAAAVAPAKVPDGDIISIKAELRVSEAWKALKDEFEAGELKYFEESYIKLMSQFRGDVLASEETQVFQTIKFELLMSRNLKERRKSREDVERLEDMQRNFVISHPDPRQWSPDDKAYALDLEGQLTTSKQAEQNRTNEYVKLQERHDALLKALKSTRDQRVKQIESSKISFLGVIRQLQERDEANLQGRQLELTKLAGMKEHERLGRPVKYEDGSEDSPILSADTVDLGPEGSESSDDDVED